MNYQEMLGSWNGFLKRSCLALHNICFVTGLLTLFAILGYPYIATPEPSSAAISGAFFAGLISFALINALGTAYRYCISGDIQWFPRRTLAAYFPAGSAATLGSAAAVATAAAPLAETPVASISVAEMVAASSNREGVSGSWEAELASDTYGTIPIIFKLLQQGSELTGTVESSMFQPMAIEEGKFIDGFATWKASGTDPMPFSLSFDVHFADDQIFGEADFGQFGSGTITGKRTTSSKLNDASKTATASLEPRRWTTIAPDEISEELLPVLEELGLVENCRQLAAEGWTVIENAADPEFITRLRNAIIQHTPLTGAESSTTGGLVGKETVFDEAAINPKLMAVAEFSVGRGFLLSSMVSTIRSGVAPALEMHADQVYFPEPLPEHNMMLTCCWVTDEFTVENGPTAVASGTHRLLRHPSELEIAARADMQPILCPAGSVAVWDGRVWHGNAKKTSAGQRVVLHTSYQRMVVRPNEDFTQVADGLIERYGAPMSQLMGREDSIATKDFDYVKEYATFMRTANNGKT